MLYRVTLSVKSFEGCLEIVTPVTDIAGIAVDTKLVLSSGIT